MAERRMFAKTIIDSDAFLDMPQSSQLLYFHLAMRADDDGFINNPKSIMRNVKCSEDDLKLLILKKFLIPFDSGVVVIKHWRIHNYIRGDRYKETKYKEEKATLFLDENNVYTRSKNNHVYQMDTNGRQLVDQMDTNGRPMVDQMDTQYGDTQVRLGKDSIELGKDSIGKDRLDSNNESIVNNNTPPSRVEAEDEKPKGKRKPVEEKHRYGEYQHVLLTEKQLNKLFDDYGVNATEEAIKFLDEYIQMKGYKAKDHNLALRKWVFNAVEEDSQRQNRKYGYQNRTVDMLQDSYKMYAEWAEEMEGKENDTKRIHGDCGGN